jgi:hypothetical protein
MECGIGVLEHGRWACREWRQDNTSPMEMRPKGWTGSAVATKSKEQSNYLHMLFF